MKHKLLFLVPVVIAVIFLSGCFGGKSTPAPSLSGSFSGQFTLFHRHSTTSPWDTLKASITLTLSPAPGDSYAVTGDTSTVIAGSKGNYQLATNGNFILFLDSTLPTTGISSKVHLNGEYVYSYDGNTLQMLAGAPDTLQVQYNLKKN
ncbi:MAG TPA: hypothetical protein VG367_06020 [Mucilaginibacter sp.]|jgi:hypothetical protein|nr:hypothetical protein [Mucilaginibacter sp.]